MAASGDQSHDTGTPGAYASRRNAYLMWLACQFALRAVVKEKEQVK